MSLHGHTVLYGGSFDPPHMGHQMACLYLLEALAAAEVWLIPAWAHPFGKPLSDFAARRTMCELLISVFGARARVSSVEEQLHGAGRTYDTLVQLRQQYPQRSFALALGADLLQQTPQWYRWDDVVALVPIVVIGRAGYESAACSVELPDISSSQLRQRLAAGESAAGLVPASVAHYITDQKLYRQAGPSR